MDIGVAFAFIHIYFSATPSISSWSREEIFVVYGMFQLVGALYRLFCADSLEELDYIVRTGKMDQFLTKPIDSQFYLSVHKIWISNVYRVAIALFVMWFALHRLQVSPSPSDVLWASIGIVCGVIIYYAILLMSALSSFWTSRGEVTHLMDTIFSITKYPLDIFGRGATQVFKLIPLIFIVTIPSKILLGKEDSLIYVSPVVALAFLVLSRKLWFLALRHYSSASS